MLPAVQGPALKRLEMICLDLSGYRSLLLPLAVAVALFSTSLSYGLEEDIAPSVVTREEALSMAESYRTHAWTPTEQNLFHGKDTEGIQVETPNAGFSPVNDRPGWWEIGKANTGIPYMWGGFDTPESFDAGLKEGKWAGDIYTAEKRRLLDDGVTKRAVGIDCSGFVSRCWKLPRSFSTRELPALCDPISDLAQLKPGDIFNTHNAHVVLFAGWLDDAHASLKAYEAGGNPEWRVLLSTMSLQSLLDQGYTAWRYRGIRD
jgi:hypothetical protein